MNNISIALSYFSVTPCCSKKKKKSPSQATEGFQNLLPTCLTPFHSPAPSIVTSPAVCECSEHFVASLISGLGAVLSSDARIFSHVLLCGTSSCSRAQLRCAFLPDVVGDGR